MRILLAEDDLLLGDGIRAGLRLEGDTVEWVTDGVARRTRWSPTSSTCWCSTSDCRAAAA